MCNDCFALKNNKCGILLIKKCPENCKFYKTPAQLKTERRKCCEHLVDIERFDLIKKYKVLEGLR